MAGVSIDRGVVPGLGSGQIRAYVDDGSAQEETNANHRRRFSQVHEPLTVETVDMDKPWGREVLVRTVATGVCHSDLHVVDGNGRYRSRSSVRAGA